MKGAIIGDIVGSIYEFHNIKEKDFPFFDEGCFFTDDSVMTVAVADALLTTVKRPVNGAGMLEYFRRCMKQWGKRYPYSGYGNKFLHWIMEHDSKPYYSCGNGSAMRVSPVGFWAKSLEEAEHLALLSAMETHNHPDGIAGAEATAGAVYLALHGATKEEIKAYVEKFYPIDFTLDEIRPEYHFGHFQALNEGTVPYAVEAFPESNSFEEAIRNVISIGGDSDTLAAITGAIAEAYYGVPDDLWETVEKKYLDKFPLQVVHEFYEAIENRK